MKLDIPLKCTCGKLRGVAHVPQKDVGSRVVCLCDDCQTYAHYLGRAQDILDANGGTDIIPVVPANLEIVEGIEHLRCVRLSHKGLFRWYTGCCKTPIANTLATPKSPYAGVVHLIMDHKAHGKTRDEELGPVSARIHARFGIGPLPSNSYDKAPAKLIFKTIRFLLSSLLRRQFEPSPFVSTETGALKVEPYVMTLEERQKFRAFAKN